MTVKLNTTYSITYPSANGVNDGTIQAIPTGGTAPYSYLWSTGSTDQNLTNVTNGNYQVTITEQYGCTKKDSVSVWTVSTNDLYNDMKFLVSPNPSKGQIHIDLGRSVNHTLLIRIYNTIGKMVDSQFIPENSKEIYFTTHLESGMYIIEIPGYPTQKLIIQ